MTGCTNSSLLEVSLDAGTVAPLDRQLKFLASRETGAKEEMHYDSRNSLSPRNYETSCLLWADVFRRCR
jgi:hypothetical protein